MLGRPFDQNLIHLRSPLGSLQVCGNLSGRFLIALSVLRSSASSTRSSSFRYSSMLKITAVGFPPRITISGSFRFRLVFIRLHLDGHPDYHCHVIPSINSTQAARSNRFSRSMVRPFEKPHGRLPRRPSVPSPSRNHHDRLDLLLVPSIRLRTGSELVEGCTPSKSFNSASEFGQNFRSLLDSARFGQERIIKG
jgi:hypothetical protein